MTNIDHDCNDTDTHHCTVIGIQVLYIPPSQVPIGQEGNTIVMCQLSSEIHIYRLWKCGSIEVSINHSIWVKYVPGLVSPASGNHNHQ